MQNNRIISAGYKCKNLIKNKKGCYLIAGTRKSPKKQKKSNLRALQVALFICIFWSGRLDLNQRPPEPH
jgi:hypothetical protein